MRKISRVHTKKVTIPDEDEEEKIRKTEGKMAIIRAEFEKHKKEQIISVTEASKLNEVRLKNQLEELLTDNAKKLDSLKRLEENEKKLYKQNMEDTQFYETISKFESSKTDNAYLSVGLHPNRTTSLLYGMNDKDARAELLGDKMAELMETLSNIELMIEEEEEISSSIQGKYDELRKDQVLSTKKVNELKKMNDHADKRFADLGRIEFLARTKHAAATSDLKELKEDLRELKYQELTYKKQKEDEKKRETEYLSAKQAEMSHIMIEIDKKRHELHHFQEEVKRLELKYEEMRDKRKNTRIVTKYIDTFAALDEKPGNLLVAHQALISETPDVSRSSSPLKTPSGQVSPSASNKDGSPQAKTPHVKRNSFFERNVYIEKIQKLYERHPEGPEKIADALIQQYLNQTYQEESLKSNYEELQNNKKNQETELQALEEELRIFKRKNDYITLGKTGSKILDSNEQEAIDSGMLIFGSQPTTLNQAKFEFENQKEADNDTNLFVATEAFMMRCYMDSIEMIARFSKILTSINHQSAGSLSEEMKELTRLATLQISILKKSKKSKPEMSASQIASEVFPENKNPTDSSNVSEREKDNQDPITTLDLNEVQDAFLAAFYGEDERAAEFVEYVNNDVMIITFITLEDIKNFLDNCKLDPFNDQNIQRAFDRINNLRKIAIENMLQKFETVYKIYSEIITTTQRNTDNLFRNLQWEGVQVTKQQDILDKDLAESNEFVKKALDKKWKNLMDRYDYDPNRDWRKTTHEDEPSENDINQHIKEKTDEADNSKEEIWDKEDTKAKLNEIVDARSRKTLYKNNNEEDQKRLQAKKEKEKQKLALENMSDDDYLNWQRNRIRNDGKEDIILNEINESELLRKAQADLALRLSSSAAPIGELKRMIQNSKVLSKIQILERQKGLTDGKRNLKYEPTENYIPPEPIKVPKSPHSPNQSFNPRLSRNVYTPSTKPAVSRFATSSERMTESDYAETPKDMTTTSKSVFAKTSSKFKPIDAQFDFSSQQTQENEKPKTQVGGRRLRTLNNFQAIPSILSSPMVSPGERRESQPKKPLRESSQKKELNTRDKNKFEKGLLPKLKTKKKKNRTNKKAKRNSDLISTDHENIDSLLRIQTDPLLKMVYSPTFFAQSLHNSTYSAEDLGYRFDSYKFSSPGLLISEKINQ